MASPFVKKLVDLGLSKTEINNFSRELIQSFISHAGSQSIEAAAITAASEIDALATDITRDMTSPILGATNPTRSQEDCPRAHPNNDSEDDGFTTVQPNKRKRPTKDPDAAAKKAPPTQPDCNRFSPLDMETENTVPEETKQKPPPPVIIRAADKWTAISARLNERRYNFTKAKAIAAGIQVQPATPDDHRGITATLDSMDIYYHTYMLAEDKPLKAVLRGIPVGIADTEIEEDLRGQGFNIESARRMKKNGNPMPLVFINLKRQESSKNIFQLAHCCALKIQVEAPNKKKTIGQCYRCQKFHHTQRCCRAEIRCVKCAGEHRASECPRKREEKATCVNCGGEHPASYRGCPRFPQPKRVLATPSISSRRPPGSAQEPTSSGITQVTNATVSASTSSYSQAATGTALQMRTEESIPPVAANHTNSPNTSTIGQLLQLLQKIDLTKVIAVVQKVANAISGKTTLPEIITALMPCLPDITSLLSTHG